jgi:hypothetical protein
MPERVAAQIAASKTLPRDPTKINDVIIRGFRRGEGKSISPEEAECIWPNKDGGADGGAYFIERVKGAVWYVLPEEARHLVKQKNEESWAALGWEEKVKILGLWGPAPAGRKPPAIFD